VSLQYFLEIPGRDAALLTRKMAFTRRHLPHWIREETAVFVTWRLAGSLPPQEDMLGWDRPSTFVACHASPKHRSSTDDSNRPSVLPLLRHDERLDSLRSGPVWLQDARVAGVVANSLQYGEKVRRFYDLHAWVVMPNHAHVVFRPLTAMPTIMRWLKGRTGRVDNQILGRTGTPFWQDESFDHWVRSADELQDLIEYVENNPVKAGLVEAKERWQWSSAGWLTDDKNRSSVPPQPAAFTTSE
jgi:REP element-mobilizing transposase RayT